MDLTKLNMNCLDVPGWSGVEDTDTDQSTSSAAGDTRQRNKKQSRASQAPSQTKPR